MTESPTQRPVWFVDWRKLWWYECRNLGMMIAGYIEDADYRAFDGRRVRMTKELYQQIRRVQRIGKRLNLESEVMDRTWCDSMMRWIFDKSED